MAKSKAEFVQLAHNLVEEKHFVNGWFLSEKLDGMRAIWDGGITKGIWVDELPKYGFKPNNEKDGRYLIRQKCTGLWTRYCKPIQAPEWWLNKLPIGLPLDGELYCGPGKFQKVVSICKDLNPGPEWDRVQYHIFDCPQLTQLFGNRECKFSIGKNITRSAFENCTFINNDKLIRLRHYGFEDVYNNFLIRQLEQNEILKVLPQKQLHWTSAIVKDEIYTELEKVTNRGGEGLILRHPRSIWVPTRTYELLKMKKLLDAEANVIGCIFGKATERGSKLLGMMGSLRVKLDNGKMFDLSGFTDMERKLTTLPLDNQEEAYEYARSHEGEIAPLHIYPVNFPVGSRVGFRYRELTIDGLPKEARYWRK